MKPRFEEHEGQLFRMLDEPEPLTKKEKTMKPRFEEHEGKLFKMLEEPTPLTPDAEMPCLVRLIQDDSPMGKHNKDLHGFDPERLTPRICTEVVGVNDLSDPNRGSARCDGFMSIQYYRYELIGTHVKVGDWVELNVYNNHQGQIKKMFPAGMGELCGTRIHRTEPTFLITGLSGEFHYDTITRKLSPADIVIHIGCLSGTVRRINDIFFCLNPSTEKGRVVPEARIPHAMLDTHTRELVESLLKAQEEEK